MQVDYTEVFDNPDQLADFLMLPNFEQIRLLAQCAGNLKNMVTVCDLSKRTPSQEEQK